MLEDKRVGGMLWLKQNAPCCCLWPLQPQPSHSYTFVNAWKTLSDLMMVTTVCNCNGTDLWTNHPLLPSRIRTRQSRVYSGCQELLHLGAGAAEIRDTHPSLSSHPSQLLPLLISKLVIKVCSCCTFLNWHLGPYSSRNSHWSVLEHRLSKPSGTSAVFAAWCSSDTSQFQNNFVTLKQHYQCVFSWP